MRIFLKKVIVFFVIMAVSIALFILFDFCVVKNQYRQLYTATIEDKIDRLYSIKEPK